MLGGQAAKKFDAKRHYEPACSGLVLYWTEPPLPTPLTPQLCYVIPQEEFHAIYERGQFSQTPTCYICAPARTEPAVAPPGGGRRSSSRAYTVSAARIRLEETVSAISPNNSQKVARAAGLSRYITIEFEHYLTPEDIDARYESSETHIYGIASHGRLQGGFKPANHDSELSGLYLAGGAAHPGPGMPMVMMSGWIAADRLDRDQVVERARAAVV